MKIFEIEWNGCLWEFPASIVADNRAKYYAEKDKDTTYDEEFKYAMDEDVELIDWFGNNMDWEDVEDKATLVRQAVITKPDLSSGDCEVYVTQKPQDE